MKRSGYSSGVNAGDIKLKDKIKHVLEELRIVLPGTQAVFGFQLNAVFANGFTKLNKYYQYAHLLSMCFMLVTISSIMFVTAYHRLVEKGEDTERFHAVGSYSIIVSLFTLAIGLAIDFYIITYVITKSDTMAAVIAIFSLLMMYILWFGVSFYFRKIRS